MSQLPSKLILFDGVCNFCDASINFVIDRDPSGKFKYASLQSDAGQEVLNKFGLPTSDFDSFVYVEEEKYYTKSSAALKVAQQLGGGWGAMGIFFIVPKFIRDSVYSLIARNRYKWFGKKDECMLPSPEVRARFLV